MPARTANIVSTALKRVENVGFVSSYPTLKNMRRAINIAVLMAIVGACPAFAQRTELLGTARSGVGKTIEHIDSKYGKRQIHMVGD